jgi:hypothetical protein
VSQPIKQHYSLPLLGELQISQNESVFTKLEGSNPLTQSTATESNVSQFHLHNLGASDLDCSTNLRIIRSYAIYSFRAAARG